MKKKSYIILLSIISKSKDRYLICLGLWDYWYDAKSLIWSFKEEVNFISCIKANQWPFMDVDILVFINYACLMANGFY